MRSVWTVVLLTTLFVANPALAQRSESQHSAAPQSSQKWADFYAKLDVLHKAGRTAYADEMQREKAGDCANAQNTYETNVCLSKEVEKTTANYKAYTGALRSSEALASPGEPGASGPTGKPLPPAQLAKEFDNAESAWQQYYEAQCTAAYDAYKGGTIAPSMELTCRLQLMRDRMHALENIYQFMH